MAVGTVTYALCLIFLPTALGGKILLVSVFGSDSTMNNLQGLADHLASRGHEIIYVRRERIIKNTTPNISYVLVPDRTSEEELSQLRAFLFDQSLFNKYPFYWIMYLKYLVDLCEIAYQEENVRALMNHKGQIDVVIFDFLLQDCLLPLVYDLGAPIIFMHGNVLDSVLAYQMNIPMPYSYVKNFHYDMSKEVNFMDRLLNTFTGEIAWYAQKHIMYEGAQRISGKFVPTAANSMDVFKNGSLVLGSMDTVWNEAKPMMPFSLDITAFQCRPSKLLHQDFEDAIAESGEHGFILFSMGTYFQSEYFSPESQAAFLKAFSKLKQVVLWKNSPVENQPKNVKTFPWLPQQDLLGHPKAKLFISHGGMYSLQEAVYHGTPVLGIPIFADQESNMNKIASKGLGLIIDKTNITVANLLENINKLLTDKSFKKIAETYSRLLNDQPETPLDRAGYFIDYVIRHKDVSHLKGFSSDLNFFQYFCLDILCCLILFCIMWIIGLYYLVAKIRKVMQHKKMQ